MHIRAAAGPDAAAVDEVVVAAYREQGPAAAAVSRVRDAVGNVTPIPVALREAWWEDRLRALADAADRIRTGAVLVAEERGVLVGTASVVPTEEPAVWELVRVAVHPDARGQGAGLALVREALAAATARGATSVRWASDPFQHAAHRLYAQVAGEPEVDEHGRRHYSIEL